MKLEHQLQRFHQGFNPSVSSTCTVAVHRAILPTPLMAAVTSDAKSIDECHRSSIVINDMGLHQHDIFNCDVIRLHQFEPLQILRGKFVQTFYQFVNFSEFIP